MNGYYENRVGYDENGNMMAVRTFIEYWSLDAAQVAVVLLICKGVLTLQEGVNVTGLRAEHLINEAQAWAVASEGL